MDNYSTKSKTNQWIVFAAQVFRQALKRWRITSDRQFAALTGIDARTLRKLNPKHLDASLEKETFDYIMSTMVYLCPCFFEGEEDRKEEYRLLCDSWMFVSMHVRDIHPKARATLEREMRSMGIDVVNFSDITSLETLDFTDDRFSSRNIEKMACFGKYLKINKI